MPILDTVIGVPIDSVGESGGTELGPGALRRAGVLDALGGPRDDGDLPVHLRGTERDAASGIVAYPDVMATSRAIGDAVADALRAGRRPLLLGGCCTMLVGVAVALRAERGRAGIAYLDGHLDLYDGRTSPTGEAADMPLAIVTGHGDPGLAALADDPPAVGSGDVAILGFRDAEEADTNGSLAPRDLDPPPLLWDADAVKADPAGAGTAAADALAHVPRGFWLHLDLDVLDESAFPATDYLMPDGLDWTQLRALLAPLARHPALIGANVACYNPTRTRTAAPPPGS